MGMIKVTTMGSFGNKEVIFMANEHGHAHCVNKTMMWLNEVMRTAINSDHKLHDEGHKPEKDFIIDER